MTTLSLCLKPALAWKTALIGFKNIAINRDSLITTKKKKKKTMVVEKWKTKPALFTKIVLLICVNLTPILGQYVISHNRQFKFNINELCKKASRAMYILLCNVNTFYAGNIKILKDLFDKMILPICTYNWGMAGFIFQL